MQIHHLAALEDWEQRTSETYEPAGLVTEGFIHLCTKEQLAGVVERYYRGREGLTLLTVDTDRVAARLVWENSTGVGEQFPHVHGPLNLSAVLSSVPFDVVLFEQGK